MNEVIVYCCGVRIRYPHYLIREFNEERLLTVLIQNGDNIPPICVRTINNWWAAKNITEMILSGLKAKV